MVQGFCPLVTPTSGGFRLKLFTKKFKYLTMYRRSRSRVRSKWSISRHAFITGQPVIPDTTEYTCMGSWCHEWKFICSLGSLCINSTVSYHWWIHKILTFENSFILSFEFCLWLGCGYENMLRLPANEELDCCAFCRYINNY